MTNTVSESTILPISEIALLADVNIRELDTDYVSELMQAQFEYGESHWQTHWKEKPKINQDGILFSGFHTITAAKRNFGNDHEVSFQIVEGDPYLLAACENAVHGKRRTSADKRAAVLRWLQNDEGRQWTDSHIAKQCYVSDFLVNSVDVSLQENGSDTYDRPTKRKYIDKHGNVTWMETAKINDATGESEVVIAGGKAASEVISEAKRNKSNCKRELVDILKTEGKLNAVTANTRDLAKKHHLKVDDVQQLREDVWETEIARARKNWQQAYTKIRSAWMDYEELSKSVEWETFIAATLEQVDMCFLSAETFTEADSRVKSCADYNLLDQEKNGLQTLGYHLRNPSFWVSALIPQEKKKKRKLQAIWDARSQACPDFVGDRDGGTVLLQHQGLTLEQLQDGFARYHPAIADAFLSGMERAKLGEGFFETFQERALESDVSLEDLEKECKAISIYAYDISTWQEQDWILELIAEKKGADSVSTEETATESEPDTEPDALQSLWEQVNPKISAWKQKREGVSHASKTMLLHATLKFHGLPSDTPTTPDILEKLLHLLTTRRTDILEVFVKKQLRGESLWRDEGDDASGPAIATATETDVDTEAETDAANLVDEGLSGIDLHGLDDTLSALLESLNVDEMSGSYKEVLTADLHDVFLQFEEVANAREMLIALLDAAQIVVSKFLP